jgi:hypothetical protein
MTTPPEDSPKAPWRPLDARQRRVLGVLIEKAKTTPAGYPMTSNAVTVGCNQKSNREPMTDYREGEVQEVLEELRQLGVVAEIDWMGRTAKYKHLAHEWFGVTRAELAVLTELLLRGEQTLGDLRVRASRMEPIGDLAALKVIVDGLVARGLMVELTPPGRGQMVSHGVYESGELESLRARMKGHVAPSEAPASHASAAGPARESLASELEALRAEIAELRDRVAALEARGTEHTS